MADTPEAAAPATEATPTSTNNEPTQAPEQATVPEVNAEQVAKYLGTNAETLNKFQKFVEANGQFDTAFNKMKSGISNPEPKAEEKPAEKPAEQPTSQAQAQPVEQTPPAQPKTPEGAITQAEFLAQQYFKALAGEEKYAPISKEIASGDLLKEMASFNIQPLNQDGSINDTMVRRYLDLKAQTVPAQPTNSEPNMSNAPTVDYIAVGDKIENMEQAQAVFMQAGHPKREMAKEFIKAQLNPNAAKTEEKK